MKTKNRVSGTMFLTYLVPVIIALKEICQRSGAFSFPHCLFKSLSFTLLSATTAQFPVKKNIEKA